MARSMMAGKPAKGDRKMTEKEIKEIEQIVRKVLGDVVLSLAKGISRKGKKRKKRLVKLDSPVYSFPLSFPFPDKGAEDTPGPRSDGGCTY